MVLVSLQLNLQPMVNNQTPGSDVVLFYWATRDRKTLSRFGEPKQTLYERLGVEVCSHRTASSRKTWPKYPALSHYHTY